MQELVKLREDTSTEDEFAALYQQERERINYFWIAEKKNLEDKQADLRNKEREVQDLRDRHQVEINTWKQRVKHLLYQNLDKLVDKKTEAEETLINSEVDHRVDQRELKEDKRALKRQKKEVEVCHEDYMRAVKKDQDKKMTAVRHEFERKSTELKNRYTERMNKTRSDMEAKKKAMIERIEAKMNQAIKELTAEHHDKYIKIKTYYNSITSSNFEMIKELKEKVGKHRVTEAEDLKKLRKLELKKKDRAEPLKETRIKVEAKNEELEKYRHDKDSLHKTRDQIVNLENEINNWTWEYEVLKQQHDYVSQERNELYSHYHTAVAEVQQKSGLKNLLLQKKLETINETLEAKDVQLHQVLTAANLDPRTMAIVTRSLEDIEHRKNETISEIQAELKKIRESHNNMVKTYEGKLAEFGIPVEELGFDPLVPANI